MQLFSLAKSGYRPNRVGDDSCSHRHAHCATIVLTASAVAPAAVALTAALTLTAAATRPCLVFPSATGPSLLPSEDGDDDGGGSLPLFWQLRGPQVRPLPLFCFFVRFYSFFLSFYLQVKDNGGSPSPSFLSPSSLSLLSLPPFPQQ